MTNRTREYKERFERELARRNISTYHFEKKTKHNALVVELNGSMHTIVFSATGSDVRGPYRAVCDLRHALGTVNKAKANDNANTPHKKSKTPRKPVHKPLRLPQAPAENICVDRYYAPLAQLGAQMRAQTANDNSGHSESPKRIRLLTPFFGASARYTTLNSLMLA
ncbi:MAG TPA: hypothetical protein VHU23_01650 [Rhizomicrobium sp.]|jgi:hypothetical protein|nr:hypothetical protein [Rhizomicrobium sp.]